MGLFKKFFSIGSKRSKKRSAVDSCAEPLPPLKEHLKPSYVDDTEAAVSRLLRSSSGRCAPDAQIGLGSLPPLRESVPGPAFDIQLMILASLAHPIDSVIPPPKSSSTTLASISARSTYSVTIHSRTVHSRTVFPNAYPDVSFTPKRSLTDSPRRRSKSVPITPRDTSRLQALRQDPSVASLLNHYDDQGHLNSALFSNTPSPQKEGRVQRRRTGSTLRQLLGHPSSPDLRSDSVEGDISWAEKFLGSASNRFFVTQILTRLLVRLTATPQYPPLALGPPPILISLTLILPMIKLRSPLNAIPQPPITQLSLLLKSNSVSPPTLHTRKLSIRHMETPCHPSVPLKYSGSLATRRGLMTVQFRGYLS